MAFEIKRELPVEEDRIQKNISKSEILQRLQELEKDVRELAIIVEQAIIVDEED